MNADGSAVPRGTGQEPAHRLPLRLPPLGVWRWNRW